MTTTENAYTQTDINPQTIPGKVMGKLVRYYQAAHGNLHRGTFIELFDTYCEGVADALYLDKNDLEEMVKEETASG